jgi:Protein of unknown function DUF262
VAHRLLIPSLPRRVTDGPYDDKVPVVTKPTVDRIRPAQLVDMALSGKIRIPPFQRPFRWDKSDVERLFDSIYRGYPIGNLLMWERSAPAAAVQLGPLSINAPAVPDALWVVDGQQRVTSLVGVLAAPAQAVDPQFHIFFDLNVRRFVAAGRRDRINHDWLPLPVALRNQDVLRWQRERPWLGEEDIETCDVVVTAIRDYEIPVYVVRGDDEQALKEIFDRLNNFGRRLRREEVFEALHAVKPGMEPSSLRGLAIAVRGFGFGELSESILMQSVLAIRGERIDRDFRNEFTSDENRHEAFLAAERALGHVVDFLRDQCEIPHQRLVPYSLYIPVLARFTALFGPPDRHSGELLRRWVWRGSVVGPAPAGNTIALRRYAGAVRDAPLASANRLLSLLPAGGASWEPDLNQVKLNSAQGKLNVLALLGQHPRVLAGNDDVMVGDLVDVRGLLHSGVNPLVHILPTQMHIPVNGTEIEFEFEGSTVMGAFVRPVSPRSLEWGQSLAARLIHPPRPRARFVAAIVRGDLATDVLHSQCLDADTVAALAAKDLDGFLARRAVQMRDVIKRNVQRFALFGFRDGPDLESLFADERAMPDGA